MKVKLIGQPQIIMSNPYGKHNYFAWPSVTWLKNGRLAVVASGFRLEHVCPFGKAVISFSEDGGQSYTPPAPVIDTPLDDRDAGILAFGSAGVMVTSFNNTRGQQRDFATGKPDEAYRRAYLDTVSDEEARYLGATFRISHDNGLSFGEVQNSPITSPHGPIELANGDILWVGTTFSAQSAPPEGEGVYAYRVLPESGRMERLGRIPDVVCDDDKVFSCEPYAFELADGTLLCHIRLQGTHYFTICQSVSHDGGKSWSVPERLLPRMGGAPAHIVQHSSGVLISVYSYRCESLGIKAMLSRDGGKSWETGHDVYVSPESVDLGYPATVECADGSLLTVFYAQPQKGRPSVIWQQRWRLELD